MPDNPSAAAFSIAVASGGAVKDVKTIPLMTTAEAIEALKKAADAEYSAPEGVLVPWAHDTG